MSIQLFFSKLSITLLFFLCCGAVSILASELSEQGVLRDISDLVPNEVKNGFEQAIARKDHERVAEQYALMHALVEGYAPANSVSTQRCVQRAKDRYMHCWSEYLGSKYSLADLHRVRGYILSTNPVMQVTIDRVYYPKFLAVFPRQNRVGGITRSYMSGGHEHSITIPMSLVTAEDIEQEEQLIAWRKRYAMLYRGFKIVSSVLAFAGLLWYWNTPGASQVS